MKSGKYNVVTGLGRSMTSAMMLALRQSGIPVIGTPFYYYLPNLSLNGLPMDIGIYFSPNSKAGEINPNGYWEVPNLAINAGLTDQYKDIGMEGDAIKVFATALTKSNPDLINKVIFMLREPKSMLTSMISASEFTLENASRASGVLAWNITDAIEFLKKNGKEFLVVKAEDFRTKPNEIMKGVCEFLGRGDYKLGAKIIDPSLNRSIPRNDLGDISALEEVYKKYETL